MLFKPKFNLKPTISEHFLVQFNFYLVFNGARMWCVSAVFHFDWEMNYCRRNWNICHFNGYIRTANSTISPLLLFVHFLFLFIIADQMSHKLSLATFNCKFYKIKIKLFLSNVQFQSFTWIQFLISEDTYLTLDMTKLIWLKTH